MGSQMPVVAPPSKRALAALLSLLCLFFGVGTGQSYADGGLQFPSFLTAQSIYQECNPSGTTDIGSLDTVMVCLRNHGQFIALIIMVRQVVEFENNTDYGESEAVEKLIETIPNLESRELSEPERPTIVASEPENCHSEAIVAALQPGGTLYALRKKTIESIQNDLTNHNGYESTDLSGLDVEATSSAFLASDAGHDATGKCFFARRQWLNAFKEYGAIAYPSEEVYWHGAIAADHLGRKADAVYLIRRAFESAGSSGSMGVSSQQIRFDYNRLGAAKIDAAARRSAQLAEARQIRAERHAELASNHKYWDSLTSDEQWVIGKEGGMRDDNAMERPCRVAVSESSYTGEILIWYYDCLGGGGIGRESWTFVNGRLTDHTIL